MKTKVIVTEDLNTPNRVRIITRESNAVTYHEGSIRVIKVTPAFLKVMPFNSWCCGYTLNAFEIHTDDVSVNDILYLQARIENNSSDVPLDPNALLASNNHGTITFDGKTLRLPFVLDSVLLRNDLEYMLDQDYEYLSYVGTFEEIQDVY